jgi:DNA repair protein RadC
METVANSTVVRKRTGKAARFQFADVLDGNKYEVTTIYRHLVREVKVATVREAPTTGEKRLKVDSPELAAQFWRETVTGSAWFDSNREAMVVLLLDTRYHLAAFSMISVGTVNESIAHPREVFRPAVVAGSYAMIVMHNHPSGDPSPSQADHSLTRRLAEAAELLQIKLLDHVIIGEKGVGGAADGYFSFKEAGVS